YGVSPRERLPMRTFFRRSRKAAPARGPRTPQLELLEDRNLLTVFTPAHLLSQPAGSLTPFGTSSPTGLSPTQVRHAYGFAQVSFSGGVQGDGTGEPIAIVDAYDDPNIAGDLHQFDLQFGLPDPTFTKVNQGGGTAMPAPDSGWAEEISLD